MTGFTQRDLLAIMIRGDDQRPLQHHRGARRGSARASAHSGVSSRDSRRAAMGSRSPESVKKELKGVA